MQTCRTLSSASSTRVHAAWLLAAMAGCASMSLFVVPARATSAPSVLVWDNDTGETFCDPDAHGEVCVEVGTELGLVRAITNNGGVASVVTQLPSDLSPYAAVYVTLGWSTPASPAGQISAAEQVELADYITSGHPVFLQGNDFAHDYNHTPLLDLFGAVFNGSGSDSTGNVSQLIGRSGTIAQGMVFSYPFGTVADTGVDDVLPGGNTPGDIVFDDQNGPGKAMSSPSEGGSPRGKSRGGGGPTPQSVARGRTVLFTTVYGAMPDGVPPATKDVLMGRVLVNFGLLATPARPTTWGGIKGLFSR